MAVIRPPHRHIHGATAVFHLPHPFFQRFGVRCRHFDQRVHIEKLLALPVEVLLDVQPGGYGIAHFLIVRTGILHIPHTGAGEHGGLRHPLQYLLFGLFIQIKAQGNAVTQLHQRG